MRARGMRAEVLLTVVSANCKDCRPKRRPPRKQTPKQLNNMVLSGDISELRAKQILDERKLLASQIQSKARYDAWVAQWGKKLKETLAPMGYEIHKVRAQLRYAKQAGNDAYAGLLEKYESVLTRERGRILLDFEADPHKYKRLKENWWDLVSEFGVESLRDRWTAVRREVKGDMKVPELLVRRK